METKLPVMESFYTIQGEGTNTGQAAYFIRLGGCDVGCVWCDVKESWDANAHPLRNISDLIAEVNAIRTDTVVITGGEPLMYNLNPLTTQLKNHGKRILLETSGAYALTGEFDWICVSPKKFKTPISEVLNKADELKVVVYNASDLHWAQTFVSTLKSGCKLLLQPEWSKEKTMLPLIINFVKDNPEWRISLQTHKYMNIP
jgi:7-carboxy-7-deazaguanine synthase